MLVVPSGPPTSFSTSTAGPRSITLSWSPPQPDQQNGILRYYVITLTSALPTISRNVSASLSNITIGGLRPYTPYSCTVRVATIGLGLPTATQRILTPEDGNVNCMQKLQQTACQSGGPETRPVQFKYITNHQDHYLGNYTGPMNRSL